MHGYQVANLYTPREEVANTISHGLGVLLSIVGLVVLVVAASLGGSARTVICCAVFGTSLIVLYTASTLYHAIPPTPAKGVLRIFDHVAIYLLIAGTYTPFTLVSLRGAWGWTIFGLVWGLAGLGILAETTALRRFRAISLVLYLAMGWMAAIAIKPLIRSLDSGGSVLLFSGGLFYTLGLAFYGWRRLPYNHTIWHLFVLTGSILHFFAVLFYVVE